MLHFWEGKPLKSNLFEPPRPPCLGHSLSLPTERMSESQDVGFQGISSPQLAEASQEGVPRGPAGTRACSHPAPTRPSTSRLPNDPNPADESSTCPFLSLCWLSPTCGIESGKAPAVHRPQSGLRSLGPQSRTHAQAHADTAQNLLPAASSWLPGLVGRALGSSVSVVTEERWGCGPQRPNLVTLKTPRASQFSLPGGSYDIKRAIISRITSEEKVLSDRQAAARHTGSRPSSQAVLPHTLGPPAPQQRRQHFAGPGHQDGIMAARPGGLGFPPGHTWDACRSGRNSLTQAGSWPLSAPAVGWDPESRLSSRSCCVETSAQRRKSRSDKSTSGDRMRGEETGGRDEGTGPVREDKTGISRREPSPQGSLPGAGSPRPLSTRRPRGCPHCPPPPSTGSLGGSVPGCVCQ